MVKKTAGQDVFSISRKGYFYAGLFFLLMCIFVIIRDLVYYNIYNFIWFCDIGLLLFSAAFFSRNVQFVKGLINIGLIAQFIFILEIVLYVLFGVSLSNLPAAIMSTGPINITISIIIHLLSTNLALLLTYKIKTMRISLLYSSLVLLLLFILTVSLTPAYENINYVFSSSFMFGLSVPYYKLLWPFLAFLAPVLPTYWLQRYLYSMSNRTKSRQAIE